MLNYSYCYAPPIKIFLPSSLIVGNNFDTISNFDLFLRVGKWYSDLICFYVLQLALNDVRYRDTLFLKKSSLFLRYIVEILVGFLFPFWSIAFLVAPKTLPGGEIIL